MISGDELLSSTWE